MKTHYREGEERKHLDSKTDYRQIRSWRGHWGIHLLQCRAITFKGSQEETVEITDNLPFVYTLSYTCPKHLPNKNVEENSEYVNMCLKPSSLHRLLNTAAFPTYNILLAQRQTQSPLSDWYSNSPAAGVEPFTNRHLGCVKLPSSRREKGKKRGRGN